MSGIGSTRPGGSIDPFSHTPATDTPAGALPTPATSAFAGDPALVAIFQGTGTLSRGARNDAAKSVQQALVTLGHLAARPGADGIFGAQTQAAVSAFQRSANLRQTGVVDQATLQALDEKMAERAGPPPAPVDAKTAMDARIAAVAQGGKQLTGNELAAAEAAIAATYGEAKAKEVLLGALGQHAGSLTLDAVGWVQGKYGSMDGHIDRYQAILGEHLAGARLIDLNQDGKLDPNDLVFTADAAGKVSTKAIGEALSNRVRIGAAMVGASEAMSTAKHDFALIKDHTFNKDFWTPDAMGRGTFKTKPGVKASDAVADMFSNPDKYKFECATGLVVVYYKAMLDLMGPAQFDRVVKDLKMGPWQYEETLRKNLHYSGQSVDATAERKAELKPGDYTYFKNWDVSEKSKAEGWQGENVIYLGGGRYFGHPFGVTTGEHIVEYLNNHRNAGSTRSAHMLDLQGRLGDGVLETE